MNNPLPPLFTFFLCILMNCSFSQTTAAFSPIEDEEPYKATISTETFHFERNKSSANNKDYPFFVVQKTNETLIADKEKVLFHNALFFDDESEVTKLTAKTTKKRSIPVEKASNPYESEGIFHSDAKIYTFSFPLSNTIPTSYEAVQKYRDFKYLSPVYFHTFYETQKKQIIVKVPTWLEVEIREFNFEEGMVTKRSFEEKGQMVYEFEMIDLEERKQESRSIGRSYELPHIMILCKSITTEGEKQNLLASADDLYKWYRSLVKQVKNDQEVLKPMVEKLTANQTSDEAKIEALFYWVQDHIRYIAFEDGIAGFRPASAQDVFNKRYGDCKGMSNLLKEMLTIAGYDARLTWLGTRHIAYDYSVPSLCVDNHMICTLIKDGKKVFLDPTEKYCPFGEFAHRIQGQQVMIENGDTYELDDIPELDAVHNRTTKKMTLHLEDTKLMGEATYEYFGEAKVELHYAYHNTQTDQREDILKNYLSHGDKNRRVSNISTKHLENRKKPLLIQHNFELDNEVMKVGEELYVTIDYGKMFVNGDMEKERKGDYTFPYRFEDVFDIDFNLPEGYSVNYLPENLNVSHPDFDFQIQFTQQDDRIQYHKKIALKNGVIPKASFEEWNKAIKSLKAIYDDRIVLIKK
ncbi:MAG: transglutaminase family protein [Chitinophagales bacterium]